MFWFKLMEYDPNEIMNERIKKKLETRLDIMEKELEKRTGKKYEYKKDIVDDYYKYIKENTNANKKNYSDFRLYYDIEYDDIADKNINYSDLENNTASLDDGYYECVIFSNIDDKSKVDVENTIVKLEKHYKNYMMDCVMKDNIKAPILIIFNEKEIELMKQYIYIYNYSI